MGGEVMRTRKLRGTDRGQGLVEFAVIFPIFALLLFSVVDGGILLGRYNNINNAAKEGARRGAVGANETQVVDRIKEQVHGILDDALISHNCSADFADTSKPKVICVDWIKGPEGESPGTAGASVRVKIKYNYSLITPLVSKITGGWDVTACAIQREEASISNPTTVSPDSTSCSN